MLHQSKTLDNQQVMREFERDIEDAIYETVIPATTTLHGERKSHRARSFKDSFGKVGAHNENYEQPVQGLNIFAKKDVIPGKKLIASQLIMSLSVCALTMAFVLPAVWWVANNVEQNSTAPDVSIQTGSVPSEIQTVVDSKGLLGAQTSSNLINVQSPNRSGSTSILNISTKPDDKSVVYVEIK